MSYGDFGDDHIREYDRQQDKWVWRKLYLRRPYLRRPYLHIYVEGPADSYGIKWHFDHKLDLRETRETRETYTRCIYLRVCRVFARGGRSFVFVGRRDRERDEGKLCSGARPQNTLNKKLTKNSLLFNTSLY